ncbi:hypothetical protein [Alicyclobacillus sp. SO9]|uniref:hypothetical protein n=1 Tax=Alicyclobacillus sp. SO9 TaxID=2665646 RepID=UPI0018E794FD|nr:hypothetical protein [Alicyclobacillus sp. SO9]QQE80994.1 hypothetical protein GI364_11800 [Alicyclobacillus sp. SO9]
MSIKISWLSNGHVVHGYRKVFVIYDGDDLLKGVVAYAPMGYEQVYRVLELAQSRSDYEGVDIDPALLWGLSLLVQQLEKNKDFFTDDGYQKQRPLPLDAGELLGASLFRDALHRGTLVLPSRFGI